MDLSSVNVQGIETVCADEGFGQPLLCLHGWGANLRYWRHVWPRLVPRFRTMAVDLPGFGRSVKPKTLSCAMDWYVDWIAAFLDSKNVKSTVLIGHSMGGMICTLFAAKYPERVRKLVLLNPVVQGPTAISARSRFSMMAGIRPLFFLGSRSIRFLRWAAKDFVSVHPMEDEDILSIRMATLKTLSRAFKSLTAADTLKGAGRITAPTLIINSGDDRIVDPAQGEMLAKALPGSKRVLFPELGHCAQLEAPERFLSAVLPFLDDVPRAIRPRQW